MCVSGRTSLNRTAPAHILIELYIGSNMENDHECRQRQIQNRSNLPSLGKTYEQNSKHNQRKCSKMYTQVVFREIFLDISIRWILIYLNVSRKQDGASRCSTWHPWPSLATACWENTQTVRLVTHVWKRAVNPGRGFLLFVYHRIAWRELQMLHISADTVGNTG